MKFYAITAMILAGLCPVSEAAPKKMEQEGLGKVLYIGDSITHGFRAPSYRWAMHKILTDNGIHYQEIGVHTGSHSNGIAPGTAYIGNSFKNVHAAMSSQRAYETSGRLHPANSNRLDKTDIFDWLEIEGKADSDKRKLGEKPDTAFILLGTNDTLSDADTDIAEKIGPIQKNLLNKKDGDMCVIVKALRTANPKVKVYVLSVPTWGERPKHTKPADYEAVVKNYNKALHGVFKKEYIDINAGLVDIANTEKLVGIRSFFAKDQLHPSPQGDLLMAGQVARSMGIAGRTAGLPRKKAAEFSRSAQQLVAAAEVKEGMTPAAEGLTLEPGKKLEAGWGDAAEVKQGFSVEFVPTLGNGAKGGWIKEPLLQLTLGNGVHTGQLNISESYIMWGQSILFPLDMSKNREPLRVAWVPGSASQNVAKGFYVWLGDMLIGEGLPDCGGQLTGLKLENLSDAAVVVKNLAAETASYAPATKLKVGSAPAVVMYDEEPAPEKK